MTSAPSLLAIDVGDDPGAWARLGFRVDDGACRVGAVTLQLRGRGAGPGLVGLTLSSGPAGTVDGLPLRAAGRPVPRHVAPAHPNGVVALDHVVAFSPDLDRTVGALERAGLALRRLREGPTPGGSVRQAFFRVGEPVLEVVEQPPDVPGGLAPDDPARLWGLAFVAGDLTALAAALGDRLSPVRPAVQPGRTIASLRRSAGLAVPLAFMSPAPRAAASTAATRG